MVATAAAGDLRRGMWISLLPRPAPLHETRLAGGAASHRTGVSIEYKLRTNFIFFRIIRVVPIQVIRGPRCLRHAHRSLQFFKAFSSPLTKSVWLIPCDAEELDGICGMAMGREAIGKVI